MPRWTMGQEERFWSKVNKCGPVHSALGSECWEWTAGTFKSGGYGQFMLDGRPQRAHRVAWIRIVGAIPEGMQVLHRCDNPLCVRVSKDPDSSHLFLGDTATNMADMARKGRASRLGCGASQPRGEAVRSSVLTAGQVREIRAAYIPWKVTQRSLALRYGVKQTTISSILNGYSWCHVE